MFTPSFSAGEQYWVRGWDWIPDDTSGTDSTAVCKVFSPRAFTAALLLGCFLSYRAALYVLAHSTHPPELAYRSV